MRGLRSKYAKSHDHEFGSKGASLGTTVLQFCSTQISAVVSIYF